jgi:transposase
MHIRIHLSKAVRQSVYERLKRAYASGQVRLVRRIHALLFVIEGQAIAEVAASLALGEQTVRDYVCTFLYKGVESLIYRKPPGRPAKLTKSQRKELTTLIEAGPEAAGYQSGCWTTVLIQDMVLRHFGVAYHPHYLAALLDQMGFSFQKARFVSDHLNEVARFAWQQQTWPEIRRLAQQKRALILFGDEASFAQWGSLSYTWAHKGQQPTVKTCGKRKAYKVFGLIDCLSGRLFWQGQTGRFTAQSYADFLTQVLAQTKQHLILIQDGAKYHTSQLMNAFFALHVDRLTKFQLPAYSPDFNPIESLWKKVKKHATHLKYFPTFETLTTAVEQTLHRFASLPGEILFLLASYSESFAAVA